jgi:hypothetical protein
MSHKLYHASHIDATKAKSKGHLALFPSDAGYRDARENPMDYSNIERCPVCEKLVFPSKEEAVKAAERYRQKLGEEQHKKFKSYRCILGMYWHIGHRPKHPVTPKNNTAKARIALFKIIAANGGSKTFEKTHATRRALSLLQKLIDEDRLEVTQENDQSVTYKFRDKEGVEATEEAA